MSSPAIPLPGKFSDARFVGDLMSLFERRKVKCGDAQSFDHFTTELVSNNAFRGDLYTLCTAISHMAAEDLSGEQLLLLVARALAGPAVAKSAAAPEIPAPMRTVFLGGYEAWSNRATAAMQEDSIWPPPRKTIPREETAPMAEHGSEPVVSKSSSEGGRTIQEALELARERSSNGLTAPRMSALGPDIEHLTISELKKLLEEIEQRVSRLGPQLAQSVFPSTDDSERRARANRADGAAIPDPLAAAAEATRADALRFPRASVLPFESAGRPTPPVAPLYAEPQGELHEDPFLRRHRYLRPTERVGPATVIEGNTRPTTPGANSIPLESPASTAAAGSPTAPHGVTDGAATLQEPMKAGDAGRTAALPGPMAMGTTAPVGALPAMVLPPRTDVSGAGAIPRDAWYPSDDENLNIRIGIAGILAVAALFVIAGSLSGLFIYHSMHPKTIYDFPHLAEPAPVSMSPSPHDSQVILAVPDDSAETPNPPPVSGNHGSGSNRSAGHPATRTSSAATVWPPSNRETPRAARPEVAPSAPSQTANPQTEPVRVPATTMIGYALYAPKPAYPTEQAQGIGGTVELEVSISKRGTVTSAHAVSGPPELWRAAEKAVEEWRFRPYFVDGEPTDVTTTVGFFFNGG